ncbi:alpha-L-fucosidase, partial [bacterium]|nr:alpha-L-fucosidase [bacterium]
MPAQNLPAYLSAHADLYAKDPHAAALQWFREARYGMFIHYGLYSLLGRHEWVMYHEKIHVAEYEKLARGFNAEKFDPEAIADLAVNAGMKYINFVTRHHDSSSLWDTKESDFNSVNSVAKRDLVREMAEA